MAEEKLLLSPKRRKAVTLGVMVGLFLAAMEATVVGTAMPTVISSLGGLHIYSWVFSLYLLTSTVTIPVWGKLSDLYGRKKFYMAGISLFLVGSVLSGTASSMGQLIFFRGIQGLGAGAIMPLGLTIVGEIYTLEQRAKMQGYLSGMWGLASLVGPLLGGILTQHLSWRWVFYVNIPFGLCTLAIISVSLQEFRKDERVSLDHLGAFLFVCCITLLLLSLTYGGTHYPWLSFPILSMLAGFLVFLYAFYKREQVAEDPMLHLELFSNRMFASTVLNGFLTGMAMFGTIAFVPLFVQGVIGKGPVEAGTALTPFILTWVTFSVIGVKVILRLGPRKTALLGCSILTCSFYFLTLVSESAGWARIAVNMAFGGAGMGFLMAPLLIAVQSSVPRKILGMATGALQFFRTIGGAVGVACMGSLMSITLSHELARMKMGAASIDPNLLVNPFERLKLPPHQLAPLKSALHSSLHNVFFLGFGIVFLSLIFAFLIPGGEVEKYDLASPKTA